MESSNQANTKEKDLHFCKSFGADDQIRTGDLILTKDALYRLSYISTPSSLDARFIILHPASKCKGFFKFFYVYFR